MKKLTFIFLLLCALFSCRKTVETPVEKVFLNEYPQKWQLIKMYGQVPNSESTGTDMRCQESYVLKSDGTFIKSRDTKGVLTEGSGTFIFETVLGEKYLKLTFTTSSSIIESCTSISRTELLYIKTDTKNKMLGGAAACDGPGLEYERIE